MPVPRPAPRNTVLGQSSSGQVEFPSTCPPHRCDRLIPSPLSCVHWRPAPPVARTRRSNCLAGTTPQRPAAMRRRRNGVEASPRPTWGTLVRVRLLKHRLDAKPAPDTTPAATLLARLFLSFTAAVTLAGRTGASTLARHVQGSRPGMVSSPTVGPISGGRIQKRPLTHPGRAITDSAYVSAVVHWQGLDAPLVVELFAVCFSRQNPGGCRPPADRCRHRQTPDASAR